jgi:hypothetical protein
MNASVAAVFTGANLEKSRRNNCGKKCNYRLQNEKGAIWVVAFLCGCWYIWGNGTD